MEFFSRLRRSRNDFPGSRPKFPWAHPLCMRNRLIKALFLAFILSTFTPSCFVSADSVGQAIVSGTQDLAALAGLFCTDSVEENFLRMQLGYGAVFVSSLSLLGILGLVRGCLKIFLGLQNCQNAGFSLTTLRGFFGYDPESPSSPSDCKTLYTIVCRSPENNDYVYLRRKRINMLLFRNPCLRWASNPCDDNKLWHNTVINLGNRGSNPMLMALFGILCTGAASWLLICIDAPWNWCGSWQFQDSIST
jgi:hypothetical protein